ncbi:filamentous hemagglutinin N-terminal domain-containing protein [Microbulbifer sp. VVAC002]|uniref:filamentous hemagglutinin N-terminal domain-containing protein n=1 Tax=Microbulbifer sp. VVAC002 TaxID=3243387 RepID=UPI00403A147A
MKAKNKKLELRKLASAIKVSSFAYAGLFAGLISPMVHAGPEGGVVTGGIGTIDVDGATTTVDQVTDLLSIDWDSFNLSEEELVQFLQPDSSSIVLNRILDQDVTTIQGAIEANGHVILVNPRGVLFTETATVNVGAITASGLDMSPEDFMNGDFAFKGESGSSGVVVNRGVINASSAVLVGKQVTNASTGLISAELVSLAAADEALLTFDADGMIGVKVTKEVMENDLGLDSAVLNEGAIEGAQVLMEASVSGDLFTAAVNNEGTVTARGIDTSGGKIRLFGSGSGVVNSGTLDASGSAGGEVVLEGDFAEHSGDISVAADSGSGGYVAVLGDEVVVSGNIDARGTSAGGEVLIGGDYRGSNEDIRNAETTTVTAESTIDASGVGDSDGGTVIVWADETTNFGGTILAESGKDGGDGGLIETSGKRYLILDNDSLSVSTLSYGDGESGLWLLDPEWMEILEDCTGVVSNCTETGTLTGALAGGSITIELSDSDVASEGIFVGGDLAWSSGKSLTLASFNGVKVGEDVSINATNNGSNLIVNTGGAFTNLGSISVNVFELSVGYFESSDMSVIIQADATDNILGDITVADYGTITGNSDADSFLFSDGDDAISITGDNSFTLNAISFSGIEEVDLGGGENSITAINTATLTDTDNKAVTNLITFSNISSMAADSLEGSDSADSFEVTGDNSLTANGISFSDVDTVDAGGEGTGSDEVTGTSGEKWTLTARDNEAINSGITFSDVESLVTVNANLEGTTSAEEFVLTSDGDVEVNEMTISGMSAVVGNGNDSLDATNFDDGLTLTGNNNEVSADTLVFSGITDAETTKLTGTSDADSFTVTGNNALDAADISFTSVATVDAGDAGTGSDSVSAIGTVTLTDNDYEAETNLITFSDIESVTADSLEGSDSADTFIITGDNSLTANSISFSSVDTVDAGDEGTGSDSVTAISTVTLTDSDYEATSSSITFSDIESVTAAGSLVGSVNDDTFVVVSDTEVTANGISVTGFGTSIDAGSGDDSVTGASGEDWTLTSNDEEAKNSDITFTEVEILVATSANLQGTAGVEDFVLTSTGDVEVNDMTVSGMSEVYGNDGDDSLDATDFSNGLTLTDTDNKVTADTLAFYNITDAVTLTLTGTSDDESFTVNGDNAVTANGIAFTKVDDVTTGGGSDTVTGASGADWTLTSNDKEAESSEISFTGVETLVATSANLQGTAGVEDFVLTSTGDVEVNGMTVSGMSEVYGNDGDDSLDATDFANGLTLTDTDNKVTADTLAFYNITDAVTLTLTGTSDDESFTVNGDNAVTANGIAFTKVDDVATGGGSDTVTGASGADWTLTSNDKEAESSEITFSGVETLVATSANLQGTAGVEDFVLTSTGDVEVNGMTVSGMSEVYGNDGDDSLDATDFSNGLTLTDTDNKVTADTLAFYNITDAATSALTGTSDADSFTITGDKALDAAGISFTEVDTVDAGDEGTGSDSVTAISTVALTDTDYEAISNLITFSDIESVSGGNLVASSGDDTFEVTGFEALKANQIAFSDIDSVDAMGGTDDVTGASGEDWLLGSSAKEGTNNGITFTGVEILVASNANLQGTAGVEDFVLTSTGDVEVNGMTVSGMSEVYGNDGDDSLDATDFVNGLTLTDTNNKVTADTLAFYNITDAVTSALTGTSDADSFTITGDKALDTAGISFTEVDTVDAGGAGTGSDSVTAISTVTLTDSDYEATSSSITFSDIESVTAAGSLVGSVNDDTFVVVSDTEVTANGISVTGFGTSIDAGSGDDSVTGASGEDWTLTSNDEEAKNSDITFTEVEILVATSANLQGTAGVEDFVLTSTGDVEVNGMTVSGMSEVYGNDGDDSLDATDFANGLTLTDTDNKVTADTLAFYNITDAVTLTLTGTSDDESFTVNGDNAVTANGIAFTKVDDVATGGGSDTVTGASGADWTLTSNDKEAESSEITFSGVETLVATSANLQGTAGVEDFVLTSTGDVEVNGMTVSGMSEVYGNDGDDSLDATDFANGLTLTDTDNKVTADTLAFYNITDAVTLTLTGTSDDESFTVNGDNAVTANGIAFTKVDDVATGGGSDTVTGASGADWTLTSNDKEAESSEISFTGVETLVATSANLQGTAGVEDFVLTSTGDVEVNGMTVSGMSEVYGNDGDDSLDATDFSNGLTLTDTDNKVTADTLAFYNITDAATSALTGTSDADSFTITGDKALDAAGISFTEVDTVDAGDEGTGSDSVTAISTVALTDTDYEAISNLITFSDIESVSGGNLVASSGDDTFEVTGFEALKANQIAFSDIDSVDAMGGTDDVTGASGEDWLLGSSAKEGTNNGITFTGVEILVASNANLQGTAGVEDFVLTSTGDVEVNGMTVSGMSEVYGNDGDDSLDATDFVNGLTLTDTNNKVTADTLAFYNITDAVTSALTGTSDADSFTITGDKALDAAGISFTEVDTVDAGGAGTGSDSVTAISTVTLTDSDYEATSSSITFSDIESVTAAGSLVGSVNDDTFVVVSDTEVTANGISVTGFGTSIDAGSGDDSVTGASGEDWTLTSNDEEAKNSDITFTEVEILVATSANLQGTAGVEDFVLTSTGDVEVNDMTVSGMSEVYGNDGDDSLDATDFSNGLTLTDTDNKVTADTLAFYNITDAVTLTLTGTSDDESFTVNGDNAVTANGIAFTKVDDVTTGGGSDTVTGASGEDWTLTSNDKEAESSEITFTGVETLVATSANLQGTAGVEDFVLTSTGDVEVNGMTVSGMSEVYGNDGDDSLDATDFANGLTLTDTDNKVTADTLAFYNITDAATLTLTGTSDDESFTVNGDNAVTANGIAFTKVDDVATGGGSDTVTGASGADWTLTSNDKEAESSEITFSGVETLVATSANLQGTAGVEDFVLTSTGDVEVNGMTVSGMSEVYGNDGDDSLDATDFSNGLTLTDTDNKVTADTLAFYNITDAATSALTGTSDADSFTITGDKALDAAGISFTEVDMVDAGDEGTGSDSVTAISTVALTDTDYEAISNLITFSDIESVSGGNLVASSGDDTFEVTGFEALKANQIAFSDIDSVDAMGGTDDVTGASGEDWLLGSSAKEATNNGITFTGVEILVASNANLQGTAGVEDFVLTSTGDVEVNGMTVSGMSEVYGNDGDDSLDATDFVNGLTLTDTDNKVTADTLAFYNITDAVTSALTGTSDADSFTITGDKALDTAGISFTEVDTVDAGGAGTGSDSVTAISTVTLTDSDYEATSSSITFSDIESVTAAGSLVGSVNDDTFVVVSDTEVTANGISVTGFGTSIDAGSGDDSVTGASGEDWTLTSNDEEAKNSDITFTEVEILVATSANLQGTAGVEDFVLTSTGDVEVNGMTVSGMSEVYGNDGDDSLDATDFANGLTLTDTDNKVTADTLAFYNITDAATLTLTGTSDDESFTVNGDNAVTANGIAFTKVDDVATGGGSDTVTGASGADWTLTSNDKEAESSEITFTGVETLVATSANLQGTAGVEDFVLTSTGDVEVNGMTVSGMSEVYGNDGDDSLDATDFANGLTLTDTDNKVTADTLAFYNITDAATLTLTGTSDDESFTVNGDNAVTANGIAFTKVDDVATGGGSDTVTGASGADWTLTSNDKEAESSEITFSGVETLVATSANLQGTAGVEDFVLTSTGDVEVNGMTVSGMSEVYGNDGDDSLDATDFANGLTLTDTDNKVTADTLAFYNITDAATLTLTGTSDDESFTVNGDNAVTANGIAFTKVDDVATGGGSDTVTGASGADWTLTSNDKEAESSEITFSGVETLVATSANLQGTAGVEDFVLTSTGDVEVNGMTVSGMSEVYGNDGDDSLDATDFANGLTLTDTDNKVTADTLAFYNITDAATLTLTGTSDDESFTVNGDNAVTANGIAFTKVDDVATGGGSDTVTGASGADWTLTSNDKEAESSEITFSGVETLVATSANLQGTAGVEDFVLTSTGDVEVNGMTVSGMSEVYGNDGDDSLDATDFANGLTLTDTDNKVTADTLAFYNITDAATLTLTGTSDDESFTVNGDNAVTANGIAFTKVDDVATGGGSDTVTGASGADWTLTSNDEEAKNSDITFTEVEILVATSANLQGTAGVEDFVLTSTGDVEVNGMTVSGMSEVYGNDGDDSLDATDFANGLTLTDTDNKVTADTLAFYNITDAVTLTLTGTSDDESFTVNGDNAVTANGIAFTKVDDVATGGGSDTVTGASGADWTLTSNDKEAESSEITFSGVETLVATSANLQGTAGVEDFVLTSTGDVEVNGMTVSGMSEVYGNDGDDSLDATDFANGLTLTDTDNKVTADSLAFYNITDAVTLTLTGTSDDESFTVNGDNAVTANGIAFTKVDDVATGGGSDTVTGASGADWTLTSNDKEAESSEITFTEVEILVATSANLQGTAGVEDFVLTSTGDVEVNGMTVSGMSEVYGNDGDDSLDATDFANGLTLTDTDNKVTADTLAFYNITDAVTLTLTGTSDDESFTVNGDNAVTANGIAFTKVDDVATGGGSDTVTGASGADWTLTSNDKEAESSEITFTGVETLVATSANLQGTAGVEDFVLTSTGDVEVNDMTVSGMSEVYGNDGDDSLDATDFANGLTLTDTDNKVTADTLAFYNITDAATSALTGTSDADSFTITGDKALDAAGISFTEVDTVDAGDEGTGSDSVTAISTVALTDTDYEAISNLITFSDIESVSGGNLVASSGDDTFEVTGFEALKANQIAFSDIDSVDAMGGTDDVTGASGEDWLLGSSAKEATNNGITFTGVEILVASNANLQGTAGVEDFVLTSTGDVEVNGMTVSGMSEVYGNDGDDSLDATDFVNGLTLTDTDNKVTADTLAFYNITDAATLTLTGTSDDESFTVNGDNAVTANGIAFTKVDDVATGGGSDTVTGASGADWTLTSNDKEAESSEITFTGVETLVATSANLQGTAGVEDFVLTSTGDVEVNGMTVSGMSEVYGNDGDDSLDATDFANGLTLTDTDNKVTADTLAFYNITDAATLTLTGTSDDESFTVNGDNAVTANGIAFTKVDDVATGGGSDTVTGASGADWTLTSNDKEAESSEITFTGVETLVATSANLQGTAGVEDFVLTSTGDVEVNGMTVSGMSEVYGNDGDDSLDATDFANGLTLTDTDNKVTADTLAFYNITDAATLTLTGTSDDESFTVNGDNAVTANGIAFTKVDDVATGGGSDTVTGASGADWTLTSNDKEAESSEITFSGVETLVATSANLQGTAGVEDFVLTSTGDVEVNGMTVSGMSEVYGNDGDDSLDATDFANGLTLTDTDNKVTADTLAFYNITDAATLTLTGTSDDESFTVNGDNAVTANGIAFTKVDDVATGGGSDTVTGASGADWTLTSNDKEAESSEITFTGVETLVATSANLQGTAGVEDFVLTSTGDVEVNGMTVSGMSEVYGNDGDDSLDATDFANGLTLTDTDNKVTADTLAFYNITDAATLTLTGTSDDESFTVNGDNAVTANGIAFTKVDDVATGGGSDTVTGASGADWTLTSNDKEAESSEITFSGVETLVATSANLQGTAGVEDFVLTSTGDVEVNGMTVSGMSEVYGNDGDDSLDATDFANGLTLTDTDNKVTADTLAFYNITDAATLTLTGTSDDESFTVNGDNAVTANGIAFTKVDDVATGGGSDTVTGASGADWTLTSNDKEAESSEITFSGVETLVATSANLQGTAGVEDFVLTSTGDVEVNGMTVSGMSEVYGNDGDDSLDATDFANGLTLTDTDNKVTADTLAFYNITDAATLTLTGTSDDESFTVNGDNAVTANGIAFTKVDDVATGGGSDTVTGASGADWTLTSNDKEAESSEITFSGVETLVATSANLQGTAGVEDFVLTSTGDVEVNGMTVSGMSAVDGNGGDDSLDASAYSDGLSLTGVDNQVDAGSLSFYSISSAATSILTNTHDSAQFELQGDQALATAGISFTGLEEVNTSGSNDTLVATDSDDNFTLNSDGDISVAGIDFSGLETVDGAGGSDTVSADGATWTSTSSGTSLVEGSVEAEVNGLTVYFDNLELVEGAGSYTGQDIDGEYEFSALDTMTIGGVTFADLDSVAAGSGTDTVYGADIDAVWDINDSEHTVSSGGASLTITGIESITAGSGADEFNLNGGELAGIDTGAGSDTVTFSGTVIDSISLGAGNDFLTVETDIGQEVELAGGDGSDDFQYNLSGTTWELYSSGNQVGNFSFAGFEYLDNTSDSITVLTDLAFDFEDGGSRSESFNKNGAGLQFSDMRLGYDGEGDIYVTSNSTDTIGGSLTADRAELVVGGDVDIETDVSVLAVATSGADINISVQAAGDLVIDEIDAGRGTVSLASSSFGTLTAETYGDTHITASAVTLGTETELWTIIGEATNPLRMDVTNTVDIYSVSYYEPDFIGQIPTVTSTGDELQSVAGAQASQGLKSAVQNAVEDFSHVDPAIFSAVKPYSSGVDAVNSPEMRLRSGELSPAVASAAEEVEAAPKFDAELELGTSDAPSDITVDLGEFNGGSAGH